MRTLVGCCLWLSDENIPHKLDRFRESAWSLNRLREQCDITLIDNGSVDEVNTQIMDAGLLDIDRITLPRNFYDVACHLCTYWDAERRGNEFMVYSWDDFVWDDDDNWVADCESFMDENVDVCAIRLARYVHGERTYDTRYTPKSVNQHSVRHECGAKKHALWFDGPLLCGVHDFFRSNWRVNSFPTMWRTKDFGRFVSSLNVRVPVMQPFERAMYDFMDAQPLWTSGVLNGGVCQTFPNVPGSSERRRQEMTTDWRKVFINKGELREAYLRSLK